MGNCFGVVDEEEFYKTLQQINTFEEKVGKHLLLLLTRVDNIHNGSNLLEKDQLKDLINQIEVLEKQLEKYHRVKQNLTIQYYNKLIENTTRTTTNLLKKLNYSQQFDFPESVLHQHLDRNVHLEISAQRQTSV